MNTDIPMSIKMGAKSFKAIKDLDEGKRIDESPIHELCDFIDYRLDCADFRMVTVLRVLYSYRGLLTPETLARQERTVLSFKYWMDEPGDDSMCYWSENHQILFFTCAYLAGRLFPDRRFTNSGLTGAELEKRFLPRIEAWLLHRFEHGFIEWHSNTYYEEDIPPLCLLIDFAEKALAAKATIVLDLFVADMAMHAHKGLFSVTSGRCYEEQKRNPLSQDTLEIVEFLFGPRYVKEFDYTRISSSLFLCRNYQVPEILKEIAGDGSTAIVKTSMGHELGEVKALAREKGEETAGYIQWAMEAFTNPEVIRRTLRMFRAYNMKANAFLKDFSMLDIPGLGFLLPLVSRILNPVQDGVAIQRANTYAYRTRDFILSTAQSHHPGAFGDQQHIWQATINERISVFTTHPGAPFYDDNARNFSPSYWVGNGVMPHAFQNENVVLAIYDTRGRKGFMERARVGFTHAHFPVPAFDEAFVEGRFAFGRSGPVKVALVGGNPLEPNPEDPSELIQRGRVTWWACELSAGDGSLAEFAERIRALPLSFDGKTLRYRNIALRYGKGATVDGVRADTDYRRLESPYGDFRRGDEKLEFNHKGRKLTLDFHNMIRIEEN